MLNKYLKYRYFKYKPRSDILTLYQYLLLFKYYNKHIINIDTTFEILYQYCDNI